MTRQTRRAQARRERVKRILTATKFPLYCPHVPHPAQYLFLSLDDFEAFYGGAAGGGKSDALLMAALQYVDVPGYAALILRRTFADLSLPDAIMSRAKQWLIGREGVDWNDQTKTFTFPSGATLTFGYLQYANDVYRYQGSAYQFVGFDELTQFHESDYTYLLSRIRRPKDGPLAAVPLRMRGAGNPGGVGHDWVKAKFIPEVDETTGQLVHPTDEHGRIRQFVPAKLVDNPSLDRDEYERALALLDPVTRAQLLNGDWGARPPGEMFDRTFFKFVKTVAEVPIVRWVRAWDFAGTEKRKAGQDPDWTVGALMGVTADDRVLVADIRRMRGRPGEVRALLKQIAEIDDRMFGCRTIRVEQEPGSSGIFAVDQIKTDLAGYDVEGVRSTGPKSSRAAGLASWASSGKVLLLQARWTPTYLTELEAFPQEAVHDDQVDASSLGFASLINLYVPGSGEIVPSAVERGKTPYSANRRDVLAKGRSRGLRVVA